MPDTLPTSSVSPTYEMFGAHLHDGGCRFALWAPRAERVELVLVSFDRTQTNTDMERGTNGAWQLDVPGVRAGQIYGYRVHGPWNPDDGMRFNPAKLLLDPYARAITAGVDYHGPILDHTSQSNFEPDTTDSAACVPLSIVVADSPAPEPIARRRPMDESVIYEMHVKGYTRTHPLVPDHLRGTYAGLAYPAVIEHLVDLGVTAVELLPVHHFVSEPFSVAKGLRNYWGYNTLGFFAPHAAYCSVGSLGQQVDEFKAMVTAFHRAGIEVILDVVYNHTGEGGHEGPTLSFRGIDHSTYYRLNEDRRDDYDVTGCGNSLDTSQPEVLDMVLDSLRYWVTQMGVDGFRFDLATTLIRDAAHGVDQNHPFKQALAHDPVLSQVKHIAEPWDIGPYGYQVGQWGAHWSEWNDHFRDHIRDFWRMATCGVQGLATRLAGSEDLYADPTHSVNFVTAHDGFTVRDLVSYNDKHNEDNGEENRDGSNDNRSWNCGWEGETTDDTIVDLRHRQVRNLMATMLLAAGVPMITAGDEMGRTQNGNNNAYCQDSPISWLNWDDAVEWSDITELTTTLVALRASHPALRPNTYRHHGSVHTEDGQDTGRPDLAWFSESGAEMCTEEWNDQGRRTLGMYSSSEDEAFLMWFHSGDQPLGARLPARQFGENWQLELTTARPDEVIDAPLPPAAQFVIPPRSVTIFRATVRHDSAGTHDHSRPTQEPQTQGLGTADEQSPGTSGTGRMLVDDPTGQPPAGDTRQ